MADAAGLRARIKDKKAELAAFEALRDQSGALVKHLDAMKGQFAELKEGTAGEDRKRAVDEHDRVECVTQLW